MASSNSPTPDLSAYDLRVLEAVHADPGHPPIHYVPAIYPEANSPNGRAGRIAHISMACDRLGMARLLRGESWPTCIKWSPIEENSDA